MAGRQELLANQIAGDLGHERAWNFGGKERGRREGSVLPLTCASDAPWRPKSLREEVAAIWQTTILFLPKEMAAATTFSLLNEEHLLVVGRQWRAVLILLYLAMVRKLNPASSTTSQGGRRAAWSRTRGEEVPTMRSHRVVRIFKHKDEQYANC